MWYDPERGSTASGILQTCANEYEDDFRNYWELDSDDPESDRTSEQRVLNRKLYRLAVSLRASLHSLHRDSEAVQLAREIIDDLGLPSEPVQDDALIRALGSTSIVVDSLGIQLAHEASGTLEDAESRALDLLALVSARPLTPRAAAYLDRATKLFLWGFDAEAVVMSAAVLESALSSVITDTEMQELGFPAQKHYGANDYLKAAKRNGTFSRDELALAHQLRIARNTTVHAAPGLAIDAREALRSLASLLQRLFPTEP